MSVNDLKYDKPILEKSVFQVNQNFERAYKQMDKKTEVKITITTSVSIGILDEHKAKVTLSLVVGKKEDNAPFFVEITMYSLFRTNSNLSETERNRILSTEAPKILLNYIRPLVAELTSYSKYPQYNLPDMDFSNLAEEN